MTPASRMHVNQRAPESESGESFGREAGRRSGFSPKWPSPPKNGEYATHAENPRNRLCLCALAGAGDVSMPVNRIGVDFAMPMEWLLR